ncbi:type II toxin-antitoxin system HicA family toxin [Segnochrobactraceae bacterium EtOH-i3]
MPSLKCTYREFIAALLAAGFVLLRQEGSHRQYRRAEGGGVWLVTVAAHDLNADIPVGTLKSMIRQAGFAEKRFRK